MPDRPDPQLRLGDQVESEDAEDESPEADGMSEGETLSIGEVINLLREDFPDVSVSKVRFLESQGLLAPGRSEGGYRQFDQRDLQRLRFILRQQRDHFLPLKVIKSKLTLWERGEEPQPDQPAATTDLLSAGGPPVTRGELLRRSGITSDQLAELVAHGLIHPTDEDDVFESSALAIAGEARLLFDHGLEARHLRTVKHAAEREADVLAQLTAPLRKMRNVEARKQVRAVLAGAGESMIAVHRNLLVDELRRLAENGE